MSTIYRTSEKLAAKTDANADVNGICIICGLTIDSCYSQEQPSVVEATTFSRLVFNEYGLLVKHGFRFVESLWAIER